MWRAQHTREVERVAAEIRISWVGLKSTCSSIQCLCGEWWPSGGSLAGEQCGPAALRALFGPTEPEVGSSLVGCLWLLVRLCSEARLPRSATSAQAREWGEPFVCRETASPVRFPARLGALHVKVSRFPLMTSSSRPCVATRGRLSSEMHCSAEQTHRAQVLIEKPAWQSARKIWEVRY